MKRKPFWSAFVTLAVILCLGVTAPSIAQEPVTLRFSSFAPPMHFMNVKVFQPWIDMVDHRTNGRVKIKLFPGSSLGKPQDHYDMAVRGVADMTWGVLGYTPGRFPLSTVTDLPFVVTDAEAGSRIIQRLYDRGHLSSEFRDVKVLALFTGPPMDLHTTRKMVRTLEEAKGLKVRIPSPLIGKLVEKWGAGAVGMPTTEIYLSMERGVVDSVIMDPLTFWTLKINEVSKHHTKLAIATTTFFLASTERHGTAFPLTCGRL